MVCPDGRMVWSHVSGGLIQWWNILHLNLLSVYVCFLWIVWEPNLLLWDFFSLQTPWVWNPKVNIPPLDGLIRAFLWNGITGAAERGTGFWVSRLSIQNLSDSYSGYTVCVFIVNSFYYFIVLKFLFTLGNTLGKNYSDSYSVRQCYIQTIERKSELWREMDNKTCFYKLSIWREIWLDETK